SRTRSVCSYPTHRDFLSLPTRRSSGLGRLGSRCCSPAPQTRGSPASCKPRWESRSSPRPAPDRGCRWPRRRTGGTAGPCRPAAARSGTWAGSTRASAAALRRAAGAARRPAPPARSPRGGASSSAPPGPRRCTSVFPRCPWSRPRRAQRARYTQRRACGSRHTRRPASHPAPSLRSLAKAGPRPAGCRWCLEALSPPCRDLPSGLLLARGAAGLAGAAGLPVLLAERLFNLPLQLLLAPERLLLADELLHQPLLDLVDLGLLRLGQVFEAHGPELLGQHLVELEVGGRQLRSLDVGLLGLLVRSPLLVRRAQNVPEEGVGHLDLGSLGVGRERLVAGAHLFQQLGQLIIEVTVVRVQLDGLPVGGNGLVEAARLRQLVRPERRIVNHHLGPFPLAGQPGGELLLGSLLLQAGPVRGRRFFERHLRLLKAAVGHLDEVIAEDAADRL